MTDENAEKLETEDSAVEPPLATYFHVHLVSDSTGETLNAMLKATASQFAHAKPLEHIYALVRSPKQMEQTLASIEAAPGIVLYTADQPETAPPVRNTLQRDADAGGLRS